jgi:hypothetical protein
MSKILVHDVTTDRVVAIKARAQEILAEMIEQCTDELIEREPHVSPSEGITMAAYMTAAYSFYHHVSKAVETLGGTVYPVPQDTPEPGDQS